MRRLLATKMQRLTYLVICMWIVMGLVCVYYERAFSDLAVYFLSLSGFAATYVFGEIKRPSEKNSLFLRGPSSAREVMMYWVIMIWFFLGIIGLTQDLKLQEMGAYFASLTPFVSAFIIGESYKPEVPILKNDQTLLTNELAEELNEGSQNIKPTGEDTEETF